MEKRYLRFYLLNIPEKPAVNDIEFVDEYEFNEWLTAQNNYMPKPNHMIYQIIDTYKPRSDYFSKKINDGIDEFLIEDRLGEFIDKLN